MKKRNKKNCNHARLQRVARASTKDLLICSLGGSPAKVLDGRKGEFINATETLVNAICGVPHKWSCLVAVHCKVPATGEIYMKTDQPFASELKYQRNMIDELTECHQNLVDSINPAHKVNVGWIASPGGIDLINEGDLAMNIFENMGAWKNN